MILECNYSGQTPIKALLLVGKVPGKQNEIRRISGSFNSLDPAISLALSNWPSVICRKKRRQRNRTIIFNKAKSYLSGVPEVCDPNQVTLRPGHFRVACLAYRQQSLINSEAFMSTLDEDLARLNFEYLMLARECARSNPEETAWRFGLDRNGIDHLAGTTQEQLREHAESSRAVIQLLPVYVPSNLPMVAYVDLLQPCITGTADETNAL
ncbi:flagellar transcriptional regulator FlhD [Methylomonas sp. MO1]|uniref:flagellar transcriptional regulator FlhD n=1 Tax=unclassified Methylomonas TaxID=2608980 RepID=UPI0003699EC9|nr:MULTISPECIES: flagellar transcriptional regulator FlhD [unclassified Methylomonas]MDT4291577.1 flagellar transcriptional regulator FlhD [Methylomonas sp. MO1]